MKLAIDDGVVCIEDMVGSFVKRGDRIAWVGDAVELAHALFLAYPGVVDLIDYSGEFGRWEYVEFPQDLADAEIGMWEWKKGKEQ